MKRNHRTTSAVRVQTLIENLSICGLALFAVLLLLVGGSRSITAQTIPVATATASQALTAAGVISGGTGHLAANRIGDVFYVAEGSSGSGTLYWVPRGATTATTLVTGLSGGRNVYVDSSNNVYAPSTYGGTLIEVPYVNGTYATNTAAGSVSACSGFAPTTPCAQGSAGALLSYYYQPLDVGMDAAGNLYVLNVYANGACNGTCIVEFTRGSTAYNSPTLIKSNLENTTASSGGDGNYNDQLAVAPNGDLYITTGNTNGPGGVVYYIAAGTSSATTVGSFTAPVGATSDRFGNIFITNTQSPTGVYEFPALNGVAQPSKQFAYLSTYTNTGVAFDGLGDMFYTGYSGGVILQAAQVNAISLGSANMGTAVATSATNIQFTFSGGGTSASTTVGAIASNGNGYTYTAGSCAAGATYAAAGSCTVNVNYTPSAVGLQRGAVSLTTTTGANLSTALLSGIGLGASETNDPGTVTTVGSGYSAPQDVRVDGGGNVFVADAGLNSVLRYAGGAGAPASIGTGLSKPSSVVVDGAGNVYIADAGNGRVVEVPNMAGTLTNSAQTVIASGFGSTLHIALDRYGSLYIADGSKSSITKLANLSGVPSAALTSTVGSGFSMPFALAVDFTGNLFVSDYANNSVTRIAYLGLGATTVGAGLSKPTGLITDAAGSLYVADNGNSRLLKIPLEGAAFNTNDQYVVSPTGAVPYGVGIDAVGNLYYTDLTAASVSESNRTAGTLTLSRTQINTTSAPANGYVGNSGNTALTLGTPAYAATSTNPTYFAVTPGSTNGCASGTSLAAGFDCTLSATFTPATTGTSTEQLTFNSNAVNSATKTLTLTGLGVNLAKTAVTLTQTSPTGTATFGQNVVVTATVGSTTAGTPTGTITFLVDGNAPANNVVTVANNTASITLSGLTGGSHVVTASYTGDNNFGPSSGSVTLTVAKASSTTSLAITSTAMNPTSGAPGDNVTLTARVTPNGNTAPTGGVIFYNGTTALNTTPAALTATGAGVYTATLVLTTLPVGTDSITATYTGDVNYSSSSSAAVPVVISYQTFLVTPATGTITVSSGQTGALGLTVTSLSAFATNPTYVGFACTGLPANSSCTFNPNGFVLSTSTPQPVTMQIVTGQTPVVAQPVTGASIAGRGGKLTTILLFAILAPFALWKRRRSTMALGRSTWAVAFLFMAGMATVMISGCGNGSMLFGVTPSGTYNVAVTVTATSTATYNGSVTSPTYPTAGAGCAYVVNVGAYANTLALTCSKKLAVTLVVQ